MMWQCVLFALKGLKQRCNLSCKHSFCHDCLYFYIVSQCKSTELRLGLHCLFCHVYIGIKNSSENQRNGQDFPDDSFYKKCLINFMLDKFVTKTCSDRVGDDKWLVNFISVSPRELKNNNKKPYTLLKIILHSSQF